MIRLERCGRHANVVAINNAATIRMLKECVGCFSLAVFDIPHWQADAINAMSEDAILQAMSNGGIKNRGKR